MPYVIGGLILGLLALVLTSGKKTESKPLSLPGGTLSTTQGPSGYSDAALAGLIDAADSGNQQAIAVIATLNVTTDPAVRAQLARVFGFMTKGPSGLSDAELTSVIATANLGNANATAILAKLNVSTDPAVQEQLRRVFASMGGTSRLMKRPTSQPQG